LRSSQWSVSSFSFAGKYQIIELETRSPERKGEYHISFQIPFDSDVLEWPRMDVDHFRQREIWICLEKDDYASNIVQRGSLQTWALFSSKEGYTNGTRHTTVQRIVKYCESCPGFGGFGGLIGIPESLSASRECVLGVRKKT